MTEEKEFYEQLGKLLSTSKGVKELNKKIFKDGIITINILAKDNIRKNSVKNFSKFYYIDSLKMDGNLSSELKNFVKKINLYLQNNGISNGYKDSKNNGCILNPGHGKNSSPGFLFLYAKRQISNIIKVYKNN